MSTSHLLERTRAYVTDNFLYTRPDYPLGADESLLEAGIIDSMGVMELVEFLQAEFRISVLDDEITEENLGSLNAIAGFVAAKQAAGFSAVA